MNPVFGARRRAEEFDSLLEAPASTSGLPDTPYADLLGVVATLRQAPAPLARPEFVSDLRSRLMLAAEGALSPASAAPVRTTTPRHSPRERRIATAVGGFAIVSATASMAVAAQTALPGDTLYPLKRAIENVHAGAQRADDDKGATMLGNASGRLEEVGELSRTDEQDAAAIAGTLDDFVAQASEASDLLLDDYASTGHPASIADLRDFTARSIDALTSLEAVVPDEVRASLVQASEAVRRIDELARRACPTCSDLPLTAMPEFAVSAVPPLIDDLLDQGRAGTRKPAAKGDRQPPAQAGPSTTGQPTAPATTDTTQPDDEQTDDPLPGTSNTPGGGGNGTPDNPLKDLETPVSGSDDPVGDLLSGVGDLAEGLVTGLTPKP